MLVLTRKLGETICLGDYIKIKVVKIKGKQVRIGIECPDDIKILREEVYEETSKGRDAGSDS